MSIISTASGSFVAEEGDGSLPGLVRRGQDKDLVNPCSAGLYGEHRQRGARPWCPTWWAARPSAPPSPPPCPTGRDTYETYSAEICQRLKEMMRNNVVTEYGQSQFGDLAVCAKSGTAEVGGGCRSPRLVRRVHRRS